MLETSDKEILKAQIKLVLEEMIQDTTVESDRDALQRVYNWVFGYDTAQASETGTGGVNLSSEMLAAIEKIVDEYKKGNIVSENAVTAELAKKLGQPPNVYKILQGKEEIYPQTTVEAIIGFSNAVSKILDEQDTGVMSVNGFTGKVMLKASDVQALPANTVIPEVPGVATTSSDGLMSADDKQKLDKLAPTTLASNTSDGLMSALDKEKLDSLTTVEVPGVATTSSNGLMSSLDKEKLDNLPNITLELVGEVDDGT